MPISFKKNVSRFFRHDTDITRVIETNFPEGISNHLPFWKGLHTIKVSIDGDGFNPNKISDLELNEKTVVKGYLEADNAKVLHLIGPKKKFIKRIVASYYHAVADDLAEIVYAINKYPDLELIIDLTEVRGALTTPEWDFIGYFLKCLDKEKVKYTLVELKKFDIVYINDFTLLAFPFHSGARLDVLAEFFKKHVTNPKEEAHKKVFVSRGKMNWRDPLKDAVNFSYVDDNRIDNHSEIEQVFKDLGFEVVYPEDFKNFQEQVDYFYKVKVMASLTSSGMVNGVFMQPGGTMIELVTPLITQSPVVSNEYLKNNGIDPKEYELDLNTVQEIHMFYHNLAFFKEHTYIGIPNYFRSSDKVRKFIDANPGLKEMLQK